MNSIGVYILAGGRSSRFGSDKARALLEGMPLLKHVAHLLEPVAANITVVADKPDKYADLGFRTIADLSPGNGPLGGLQTALADLPPDNHWLLICSCDALVIRADCLTNLLEARSDEYDAIAYRGDRWQPMPALYARNAQPVVNDQLRTGQLSMQALLTRLHSLPIPLPANWPDHWQANTPADLARHDRSK